MHRAVILQGDVSWTKTPSITHQKSEVPPIGLAVSLRTGMDASIGHPLLQHIYNKTATHLDLIVFLLTCTKSRCNSDSACVGRSNYSLMTWRISSQNQEKLKDVAAFFQILFVGYLLDVKVSYHSMLV